MEEQTFNEDYIKGMKLLLQKAKAQGINVRKCQWIPNVSKKLSKYNLCYAFWYNVWYQNGLNRVPLCNTWYDVLYDPDKCLFTWASTHEGHPFWSSVLTHIIGKKEIFGNETRDLSKLLRD